MILNLQSKAEVDLRGAAALVRRLGKLLGLRGQHFNVCFVGDERIRALNGVYRRKRKATDVLSFPWKPESKLEFRRGVLTPDPDREFAGFLGDIVISVETARRNAQSEGHSPKTEISCLVLHGLLHLVGMDHETDGGEMTALEHELRGRLGLTEKARSSERGALRRSGRQLRRNFEAAQER